MHAAFIVGMAGSGKSVLTATLRDHLRLTEQDVVTLNLDPGATVLPYSPDVDVRSFVDIQKLMDDYELGPNGALLMATDLAADNLEEIKEAIEETGSDLVLVDTPGQIELFAFRNSGLCISRALTDDLKAVVYVLDSPFCRDPLNYISNMFLAAAVYNRLLLPQVYALAKADLTTVEEIDQMLGWAEDVEQLELALEDRIGKTASIIAKELARAISGVGLFPEPIAVSAKEETGIVELYAALTRTLTAGEELRP